MPLTRAEIQRNYRRRKRQCLRTTTAQQQTHTMDSKGPDAGGESDSTFEEKPTMVSQTVSELAEGSTEPLAYLQGLHSGNLMQFSQQSVLQELMLEERVDIKPQINTLPSLENHNNGGYEFKMVLNEPNRSQWVYSKALNKMYIRRNVTFNINVEYTLKMPIVPLKLRAFPCFVKEVSGPVLRCQNHLSTDDASNRSERESLLRCDNPAAQYFGASDGKSIMDRYSVLVPVTTTRSGESRCVRQTLAYHFECQNSCFGRRETCLVFCLEDVSGVILGQHILYVKVCTCPKRDRNQDERQGSGLKRKANSDNSVNFIDIKSRRLLEVEETDSTDSIEGDTMPADWEVMRTENGRYRLTLDFPSQELLIKCMDGMIEKTAAAMVLDTSSHNAQLLRQHTTHLLDLKRLVTRIEDLHQNED